MRELNGKEVATCLVVLLVIILIVGDGNSFRNTIISLVLGICTVVYQQIAMRRKEE